MKNKEYILCSAIWYKELDTPVHRPKNIDKGAVICGLGHGHCISLLVALTGKRSVLPSVGEYVHGFLTSKNRFVDRIEGANIAIAAGQITKLTYSDKELYSEDLFN